jgi:DNA-binding Lrp family transcriptional regulator
VATRAYVFIETELGKTKDVLRAVQRVEGVTEADAVTGEHDVVAVVEAENLEGIGVIVAAKIQTMGGIRRTRTYVRAMDS